MKKRKLQQETEAEQYKISQKEKGVRYKEDYPSEADYFLETGKQLLTNPKYFYGKGLKGAVEGTEWLAGQPLKILFNQEGKNFEFYHPVAGEKLRINKLIEKNKPEFPTTGTLLAGDVAEVAGSVIDPFLAYGIVKGATGALKTKAPVVIEETVDPTRRDLLKMGAVITGGAIAYPTAKKLGLLETGVKVAKTGNAVRIATHGVVDNMPEFFPYLSEFSLAKGKVIGQELFSIITLPIAISLKYAFGEFFIISSSRSSQKVANGCFSNFVFAVSNNPIKSFKTFLSRTNSSVFNLKLFKIFFIDLSSGSNLA
jgi:hypothetical protein